MSPRFCLTHVLTHTEIKCSPSQVQIIRQARIQKRRKMISADDWNVLAASVLEIKAMSERGEIDDDAMREMFDKIGRE